LRKKGTSYKKKSGRAQPRAVFVPQATDIKRKGSTSKKREERGGGERPN